MTKEVWIIKGVVTDPDAHFGAIVGDIEYQFSDGPPNGRGMSSDYADLEKGLAEHSSYIVHWSE